MSDPVWRYATYAEMEAAIMAQLTTLTALRGGVHTMIGVDYTSLLSILNTTMQPESALVTHTNAVYQLRDRTNGRTTAWGVWIKGVYTAKRFDESAPFLALIEAVEHLFLPVSSDTHKQAPITLVGAEVWVEGHHLIQPKSGTTKPDTTYDLALVVLGSWDRRMNRNPDTGAPA